MSTISDWGWGWACCALFSRTMRTGLEPNFRRDIFMTLIASFIFSITRGIFYVLLGSLILIDACLILVGVVLGLVGSNRFDTPSTRSRTADLGGRILIGWDFEQNMMQLFSTTRGGRVGEFALKFGWMYAHAGGGGGGGVHTAFYVMLLFMQRNLKHRFKRAATTVGHSNTNNYCLELF